MCAGYAMCGGGDGGMRTELMGEKDGCREEGRLFV